MSIINEITMEIVKNVKDNDTINSLANEIGFAYSAVYKWILELERYGVIKLNRRGNRNTIRINKNEIYEKFQQLNNAISIVDKDNHFWELIKKLKLKVRFSKGTAATIWTEGSFITGDFYNRIYFLEVKKSDKEKLKNILDKNQIKHTEKENIEDRPLIWIVEKNNLNIEKKDGLPVVSLSELVKWAKDLELENILEHLDKKYSLGLKIKYSEVLTNV
jgi:DNA-binding Lrp family transcriptional regulator